MPSYAENPLWADVVPIPQEESSTALAQIAYSDGYAEAMAYLRAVMAAGDMSERVLGLTQDIIMMNPAHYTVWIYRARTLFALNADLDGEIAWLNPTALIHLKNYQIWHHRHTVVDALGRVPDGELAFLDDMFALDEKNYHVWSYRQWLVRRFDLWAPADAPAAALANPELRFVERLLAADVRNNSAWNHRWFVVFGRPTTTTTSSALDTPAIVLREASFAKAAIRTAPQNESPWSYLRGLAARSPAILPLASLTAFALEFAPVPALLSAAPPTPDAPVDAAATAGPAAGAGAAPGTKVTSSHALDVLAEIYAAEPEGADLACVALDLLARGYDPVRAKYWRYRKGLIGGGGAAAAAAAAAAKEGVVA